MGRGNRREDKTRSLFAATICSFFSVDMSVHLSQTSARKILSEINWIAYEFSRLSRWTGWLRFPFGNNSEAASNIAMFILFMLQEREAFKNTWSSRHQIQKFQITSFEMRKHALITWNFRVESGKTLLKKVSFLEIRRLEFRFYSVVRSFFELTMI